MRVFLVPLTGDSPPIEITRDITVIGRRAACDIRLTDPSVSKVHLILVKSHGALVFRDLCSTNGTKVNGRRVKRGILLPNDVIQLGACKFQVRVVRNGAGEPGREEFEPVGRVYRAEELAREAEKIRKEDDNRKKQDARNDGEREEQREESKSDSDSGSFFEVEVLPIQD